MDTLFVTEIIKSLGEGSYTRGIFLILIFVVLWLELKGMKKQFKALNTTISNSFEVGEKRFETIENDVHSIRLDLEALKPKPTQGGNYGNYQQATVSRGNA